MVAPNRSARTGLYSKVDYGMGMSSSISSLFPGHGEGFALLHTSTMMLCHRTKPMEPINHRLETLETVS